jgi:endonuclease IV
MEIGIKIFPEDLNYAKRIARYCDFFEVMAIPRSNFRALKAIGKPFTIHTIHGDFSFNPADPEKSKINKLGVETAVKAADILNADKIVIHPGRSETDKCNLDHTISLISKLDSRFIVENMPAFTRGIPHVGGSLQEIKKILKKTKKGMCLDFAHAAEFAHHNHIYYIDFIKKMMKLKPRYFHISDTKIQTKRDMHLHLKEGNLKLWYFEKITPKNSRVLIETRHEFRKQHNDITFLRENSA